MTQFAHHGKFRLQFSHSIHIGGWSMNFKVLTLVLTFIITPWQHALAEPSATEERFQDLFITAGYSTALGAGFGTALLAFTPNPSENLRYIAIGASIGFISGTALGTYLIFSPIVASSNYSPLNIEKGLPQNGIVIRPVMSPKLSKVIALEAAASLFSF